jgi:hypothetical protein
MSGIIWVIGYLLFILLLEFRALGRHCDDCYCYGKPCAFLVKLWRAHFFFPWAFQGSSIKKR